MNNQPKPLSVILEETRAKMTFAFNQVIAESKLPAYLVECIILEILAETRKRKNAELITDSITAYQRQANPKEVLTDPQTKECN